MGDKLIDNLMNAIDNSKKTQLWRFIHGLGIRNIGENTSKILGKKYKKIEKSINLSHNGSKALLVPPKIWTNVEFLNDKTIVLVLADYEYDFKDYIETYKEFIAFQKRNK